MPSFFPIIVVTVEDLAKFAPKFAPKLTALEIPDVAARVFVTAFPRVFATAVPVATHYQLNKRRYRANPFSFQQIF